MESDIVIVNHHLFFADLSLKDENYEGGILPEYHAVVFDEAHEIEDVAGQYFGVAGEQISSPARFAPRRSASLSRMKKFGTTWNSIAFSIGWTESDQQFLRTLRRGGPARGGFKAAAKIAFQEANEEAYSDLLAALEPR